MPLVFTFTVASSDPAVDMVGEDVVLVQLVSEVVIDSVFREVSNYNVEVVEGSGDISVREVIPPTDGLTTNQIILYVDRPTKGTRYRITTGALRGRDGSTVGATGDFIGRRTKLEDMLKGMPKHLNTGPESLIRNVLSAISIEDDRIGGGRDDFL